VDRFSETYLYVSNIREWEAYEKLKHSRNIDKLQSQRGYVTEKMVAYDAATSLEMEAAVWDWHPLFHYCTVNPRLASVLGPLP
jgi:hypothetical protein